MQIFTKTDHHLKRFIAGFVQIVQGRGSLHTDGQRKQRLGICFFERRAHTQNQA